MDVLVFFFRFGVNTLQLSINQTRATQHLPFISSWCMNERLSWLKKATAEVVLDFQTFVTSGVSSLTLSCLSKTNPLSKQHPSVLAENNDRLPFCGTQSIWILSTPTLLFMLNSLNNSWAIGDYKLINCLLGCRNIALNLTICKYIYQTNFPSTTVYLLKTSFQDLCTFTFWKWHQNKQQKQNVLTLLSAKL